MCSLILICLTVAPLIPVLLRHYSECGFMIGGATNSHTLQSGFVLFLHLEQFPSLVEPHFENLVHHVTMANKICFGYKILDPSAYFPHRLPAWCHIRTETEGADSKGSCSVML